MFTFFSKVEESKSFSAPTMVKFNLALISLINLSKEKTPFSFLILPTYKSLISLVSIFFMFLNQLEFNCEGVTS